MKTASGRILVVDDDHVNRALLSTNLKEEGYHVVTAEDGEEALETMRGQPLDVVLLDLMMPKLDGFQVLWQMKCDDALRNLPVIVISAEDDMDSVVKCIEMGAADHLPKPFNPVLLHARIGAAMISHYLAQQQETHLREMAECNDQLESRVEEQTRELRESSASLKRALDGTVLALASVVETRDPYTAGHQQRVSQLACAIAREMTLPDDVIEGIRVGGILHDVGKVSVPAEILSKPGRITEFEFGIIKGHSQVGYDILKSIEFPWPIAQMVAQHHERLDGTGYPHQLKDDQVILEARILAAADVIEAMASHRPYRAALGIDVALAELTAKSGTHFDPVVVDMCLKLFKEKGFAFEKVS